MAETRQQSISDFLKQNVESGEETREVHLKRFKSPFILRNLSGKEVSDTAKEATTKRRDKRTQQVVTTTDQNLYGNLLLTKSIVTPDLNNKELQESYGTIADPVGTLESMLTAGEMATISQEVMDLLGLDEDDSLDEVADKAKK